MEPEDASAADPSAEGTSADEGSAAGDVAARAGSVLVGHGSRYLVARAVQLVAFVAVMPAVTRLLDPRQFGVVAVALVVQQGLAALAPLGLTSVVAWDIYERRPQALDRVRRLLLSTLLLAIAIVAVAHFTGPLWSELFSDLGYSTALAVAVWTVVPITLQAACLATLQAQGRPGAFVISSLVGSVGGQLLGLAALGVDRSPTAYLAGLLAGYAAGAAIAAAAVPLRWCRPAPWRRVVAGIRHGGATVPHLLGFMVLAAADRVLIERILGLDEAARYQTAYTVGAVGLSLLFAVNNAWAPVVYAEPDEARWDVLVTTSRWVTWLAASIIAGISLAAPIALRIAAPASYEPGELTSVTVLVVACVLPNATYLAGVHVLFKRKRTGALIFVMPVAAVVNVVANVFLIRWFELPGAAAATVLGYATTAAGAMWAARRVGTRPVPWDHRSALGAYLAGALAATVAVVLPGDGPALAIRLVAAAAIGLLTLQQVRRVALAPAGPRSDGDGLSDRPRDR